MLIFDHESHCVNTKSIMLLCQQGLSAELGQKLIYPLFQVSQLIKWWRYF